MRETERITILTTDHSMFYGKNIQILHWGKKYPKGKLRKGQTQKILNFLSQIHTERESKSEL